MFNKNIGVFLLACFSLPVSSALTCLTGFAAPTAPTTKPTPVAPVATPTPTVKPTTKPTAPITKPTTKPVKKPVLSSKLAPLSETACKGIRDYVVGSLNKKPSEIKLETKVAFEDTVNKVKGTACQITTQSTGKNFKSISEVAKPLEAILIKQEWKEEKSGAADGSEGKIMRFNKGNNLVVVDIQSSLAKEVKCATDVPIDTCYQQAKPEQIKYKIVLTGTRTIK
ncbi:hypothetical protein NIES4071_16240 [Calothrix sp. NIES-4071]|nr:hypothetical protein NIES4071_16240 [Calothrix sp. NIES-4071]BAZ55958.1 hypothetical protein NIES4105_16190 [Calothrix sp. NIES-4105]